jgi:tRNA-dihydrouridine synthase A
MMEYTDRHFRYFLRGLTRRTLLYTEMITTGAIIHGNREHILGFDPEEHPLALQLGGDDPDALARSVEIAESFGYDEYNLNVGCPSERVQTGSFGACLMARPGHVAELIRAMKSRTDRPVTVKHRIGIDGQESYEELAGFVETVAAARPDRFTVHARIAVLGGLSPKENRNVPPLRYEDVWRLKQDFPQLQIEINGHIKSLDDVAAHLDHVDAVMIGRAAYDDPALFAEADARFFGALPSEVTRADVLERMVPYTRRWMERGFAPRVAARHMLGLFAGQPGARRWRQVLSGPMARDTDPQDLFDEALRKIPDDVLHAPVAAAQVAA